MRILHVVGRFPTLSETFVVNQAVGALERGHEVTIYGLLGPPRPEKVHPAVTAWRLAERSVAGQVPTPYGARLRSAVKLLAAYRGRERATALRLLDPLRHGRLALSLRLLHEAVPAFALPPFDIVHCQFGTIALEVLKLRRAGLLPGRLVTSFRGHDISAFVRRRGPRAYAPLFREGDWFIANCEHFRARLEALGCDPARLETLRSGIDLARFAYRPRGAPADRPLRLVTVGRLVEKKGIEFGLHAVASLCAAGLALDYRVVGEGPLRGALEATICALGLAGRVRLEGPLDQAELVRLLDESDILLAPSVTARNGDEDAPVNTLKEAMALGLPVVATRHGGIPELVEDGRSGFLVPERDAGAIAERVAWLAANRAAWPRMGAAGRARLARDYDLDRLNDRLVAIYERLLGRATPEARRQPQVA